MGRNFIYTSSWHEGDVVEITSDSTIEQISSNVPRVHLVVGKDVHVDFNVGFTFADGTVIEIVVVGEEKSHHRAELRAAFAAAFSDW